MNQNMWQPLETQLMMERFAKNIFRSQPHDQENHGMRTSTFLSSSSPHPEKIWEHLLCHIGKGQERSLAASC